MKRPFPREQMMRLGVVCEKWKRNIDYFKDVNALWWPIFVPNQVRSSLGKGEVQ